MAADNKRLLSPIQCFSWEDVDKDTNKLIYYDKEGTRFERLVPKDLMEKTLALFDGRSRLIHRSSGGYIPAHPLEMLIYHSPGHTEKEILQTPLIRVKLRFIDLERDDKDRVISNKLVVHYKTLPPTAIKTPSKEVDPLNQRFMMDFGHGIIPVSVFDYYRDLRELIQVGFVRTDELEAAAKAPRGSKVPIQTYRVPETVMRLASASNAEATNDYLRAQENILNLKNSGIEIIPSLFRSGSAISIPTGSSPDVLLHYLRISRDPETNALRKPLLSVLEQSEDEDSQLLPFGIFERA